MNKYKKHFLLDSKEIISYVKEKKLFSDENELIAEEIGDGNINYVFRVKDIKTGKSFVLKQADTLLRSSGRPLDIGPLATVKDFPQDAGNLPMGDPQLSARTALGWKGLPCLVEPLPGQLPSNDW